MPGGRPRLQIDLEEVKELAAEGNTQEDIATSLGFGRSQFRKKEVKKAYEDGLSEMKISLRHFLFNAAKGGDSRALIFLAKSVLGMKEEPAEKTDGKQTEALDKLVGAIKSREKDSAN